MHAETAIEEVSTKERILAAAAGLFLGKGYDAVSVREITEAAGANVAAVNYHFGGKKHLYREVIRRRLGEIAARTLASLDRVIERKGFGNLRAIIHEYVSGLLGNMFASRDEERFAEFMSREVAQGSLATDLLVEELVYPVHTLVRSAILKARPGMIPEKASLCLSSITGQILHFVRARVVIEKTSGREYNHAFLAEIVDHITDFSIRGLGE